MAAVMNQKALEMDECMQDSSSGITKITYKPVPENFKHSPVLRPLFKSLLQYLQADLEKCLGASRNFHRRHAVSFNYGMKIRYNM